MRMRKVYADDDIKIFVLFTWKVYIENIFMRGLRRPGLKSNPQINPNTTKCLKRRRKKTRVKGVFLYLLTIILALLLSHFEENLIFN
jgi:hypothetical protein